MTKNDMNFKILEKRFSAVNTSILLVNPSTQLIKIISKLKRYLIEIFPIIYTKVTHLLINFIILILFNPFYFGTCVPSSSRS